MNGIDHRLPPIEARSRLALSGRNLGQVQFVLGRRLHHNFVVLDRLKCHLGLELIRIRVRVQMEHHPLNRRDLLLAVSESGAASIRVC
jgi:hypothetical protein